MVELFLIAIAIFGYSLVSGRLAMSPVTAPLAFTTFGLIVGVAGLGLFDLAIEGEAVTILIEATLVLVLFTDAVRIDALAMLGVLMQWAPGELRSLERGGE